MLTAHFHFAGDTSSGIGTYDFYSPILRSSWSRAQKPPAGGRKAAQGSTGKSSMLTTVMSATGGCGKHSPAFQLSKSQSASMCFSARAVVLWLADRVVPHERSVSVSIPAKTELTACPSSGLHMVIAKSRARRHVCLAVGLSSVSDSSRWLCARCQGSLLSHPPLTSGMPNVSAS